MTMQQGPGITPEVGPRGGTATHPGSADVAARARERSDLVVVQRTTAGRDRVRWGAVVSGLVVAISSYVLLQLLLVAVDAVEVVDPATEDAVISGIAAAAAFLLGGVTAGATARWRGADDGVVHGVVLWATGVVAILVLSAVGGGVVLGAIDSSEAFDDLTNEEIDTVQAREDTQDAAGMALAGLTIALVASVVGGAAGAKMWPRDDDTIDLREPAPSRS